MTFDFFEYLDRDDTRDESVQMPASLVSGMVDHLTVQSVNGQLRDLARRQYLEQAVDLSQSARGTIAFPHGLGFEPDFTSLPSSRWTGFTVDFKLLTPWYSKDSRLFHVLDNPLNKDRVFGVPYMAAASWKGLVRWACTQERMTAEHIRHLFGNERGEEDDFQRGALAFYPTWFTTIGFALINPHSRETRAGTQPIYYEVVPANTTGTLHLLYAPLPGIAQQPEAVRQLLSAAEKLLTVYGVSAKRTAGWGTATVQRWRSYGPLPAPPMSGGRGRERTRGAGNG